MSIGYKIDAVKFDRRSYKFCHDASAVRSKFGEIPDLELVDNYSKLNTRKALTQCARYFKREFRYDFVQFAERPERGETPENTIGYLFESHHKIIYDRALAVGGCCFRWREYPGLRPMWALQWIWIHPYKRGAGILSRAWPEFEKRFGHFLVEPPISSGMKYFLKKHNYQFPLQESESENITITQLAE